MGCTSGSGPMRPLQERSALPPVERVPEPPPIAAKPLPEIRPIPEARPIPDAAPSIERAAPEATRPAPKESEESARPRQEISPRPAPEAAPRPAPETAPRSPAPIETIREPESPFRGKETPPAYDPTKPSLDLDSIRKRAGEIARQGTGNRAVMPFPMPPVEKPKSKMEQAIENARKPDCRDAYKALGLLAAVPLIANEFGEGTCRW
jgi:hypothetical protein